MKENSVGEKREMKSVLGERTNDVHVLGIIYLFSVLIRFVVVYIFYGLLYLGTSEATNLFV